MHRYASVQYSTGT